MAKRNLIQGFSRRGDVIELPTGPMVATRDTTELPSLTSLHWQPVSITDPSLILPGPPGPKGDSVKGEPGKPGADGKGLTNRGLWNRRTEYVANDFVTFDGSSWVAVQSSKGREPSDDSRYWQVLAAKGTDGKRGENGGAGQRGRSVRQWEIESRLTDLEDGEADLPFAVAEVDIARGKVVYVRRDDANLDLAQANAHDTSIPVGIAVDSVTAGQPCRWITGGAVTNPDWELEPGKIYFLSRDTAGELTGTEPDDVGDYVIIMGTAASPTTLIVEIHRAYRIA